MTIAVRPATGEDASAMAELINAIIRRGGTTGYRDPFNEQKIRDVFVSPPLAIACHIAEQEGRLVGFQALEWCDPDWPGEDALPSDWAVIATYVDQTCHGAGIGRALFTATRAAACKAGAVYIDATIRKENAGGQAYYEAMGFVDYRSSSEAVSKRLAP